MATMAYALKEGGRDGKCGWGHGLVCIAQEQSRVIQINVLIPLKMCSVIANPVSRIHSTYMGSPSDMSTHCVSRSGLHPESIECIVRIP